MRRHSPSITIRTAARNPSAIRTSRVTEWPPTDAGGAFHFRTIRPVAYPGRTPHIHVRVQAADGRVLATQLYLPDDPGNRTDFLFARLNADEQAALTLRFGPATPDAHPLARATRQTARADLVIA